jgi:CHRD domain-containing protein
VRFTEEDKPMRKSTAVLALFVGVGLAAASCSKGSDGLTIWQADLSPANEVPARPTAASGTAGIACDGTTVTYSVELHGITSVLFGHIHSGAAGVNGPVRVFLFPGPTTGAVDGVLVQGSFTAADMRGITFEALIAEMRAGNAYVNFHTTQFPAGEVRGQTRLLQ